jgi:NADPH:quinone reductase-like Zn-dependent oxidoreductase
MNWQETERRGMGKPGLLTAVDAIYASVLPRFNPLSMTSENKGVVAFNLSFLFACTDLLHAAVNDLSTWLEAGIIQAPKDRSFALADVAQAHQALESGETTGKVVLRTAPPFFSAAAYEATVQQASAPDR